MEDRIKIKHPGPRGWAGIARSAFDPDKHERYTESDGGNAELDKVAEPGAAQEPQGESTDGGGEEGGGETQNEVADLRAQYETAFGKKPFMGWDAETLRAKIAEAGD